MNRRARAAAATAHAAAAGIGRRAGAAAASPRARTAAALGVILAAGLLLRLYRIGDVPFGLHTDEGHNALDALRIAEGARPVFLERNNGREALFMYLMAACVAVFGPTIAAVRLSGVVAGAAVIAAQVVFARGLPLSRPRRVALFSAAFVAISFWPVAQARYALRANLLPVWVALMLWAWWRMLSGGPRRYAVLAGAFVAGAAYTHLTGRFLPLVLVAGGLWVAVRERRPRVLVDLAVAVAVALALSLPQIRYFRQQPEMLGYRADQVSVLNPDVHEGDLAGLLAGNAWNLVKTPVVEGDRSWYHNLEGRPVFDPLAGAAFLLGTILVGAALAGRRGRERQDAAVLLAAALAVTTAPSLLSVGAPNYVRLTGTWPVLFLLPALGLDRAAAWVEGRAAARVGSRWGGRVTGRCVAGGMVALTLGASLVSTTVDYFVRYAPRSEVYEAFNAAAVERGRLLRDVAAGATTYASPALWQQSVIRYLNAERPLGSFDTATGIVLPPEGASARFAFDPVEAATAAAFADRWPMLSRADMRDSRGERSLIVFELDGDARDALGRWAVGPPPPSFDPSSPAVLPPPGRLSLELDAPVDFGGHIRLQPAIGIAQASGTMSRPWHTFLAGETVVATLRFTALAPTPVDHNLFVHLVSTEDGRTLGQFDGAPLGGSYTTDAWRPGETIIVSVPITLPLDAPAGDARLRIGWYDWRDGRRLPVPGDDDAAAEVEGLSVGRQG